MQEQFVYFLGAGASAGSHSTYGRDSLCYEGDFTLQSRKVVSMNQVIPTVNRIADRVAVIGHKLKTEANSIARTDAETNLVIQAAKEMDELSYKLLREPYPDILAETFNAINYAEYSKLIKSLTYYFLLEQMYSGVDSRYKVFLTTLIAGSTRFTLPKNIKIFSWNYDYQFEEALIEKRNQAGLQLYINEIVHTHNFDIDKIESDFSLIKLNGSAAHFLKDTFSVNSPNLLFNMVEVSNPNYYESNEEERTKRRYAQFSQIMRLYPIIFKHPFESSIRFAWQKKSSDAIISSIGLLKSLYNVKEVVVIGYSFPPLNFRIDTAILSKCSNLQIITVQVDEVNFPAIKKRLLTIFKHIDRNPPIISHTPHYEDFYISENLTGLLN